MHRTIALLAALLALIVMPVFAQFSGGGSTTVTIPPPAVDWFARTVSIAALFIAAAAFVWGRVDKNIERRTARAAKDPSVDLDISGFQGGNFDYELKILNRGEVSIAVLSMACNGGVKLTSDEAVVNRDGSAIDYNGVRIERGAEETFVGQIIPPRGGGTVEFVIRIRINDPTPRVHEVRIKRTLRQ